jgi:large repetitive protein
MSRSLARLGGRAAAALVLSLSGLWAGGSAANAQSITLDRYSAAETVRDGFYLSRPDDRGHGRYGFDLHLDYANDPLVLELDPGDADSETARVVSDQLVAHLGGWVSAANRLLFFAGIDTSLLMEGETFRDPVTGGSVSPADGTSLGDARLGARLRLLGESEDFFAAALQLTASFPLAELADDGQNFAGEESLTLLPELLVELRLAGLRITGNAGILVRDELNIGGAPLGTELRFGVGLTLPIVKERLDALVEVFGTTTLDDPGRREATPVEFLAGGKYWFSRACAAGLGGGAGLQRGVGSPDFRMLLSIGCDLPSEEPASAAPDRDSDGDGLLDRQDRCVLEPEDKDQFEDDDGCPDPDNDNDGLLDAVDQCPLQPEDKDSFEDDDGCPDPDNDRDTVLDGDDRCPLVPGVPEERGCSKVRVEDGRIVILDRVEFATNKDVILEASEPLLLEVGATLKVNPQIKRVRVEGHTDSRGRDAANLDLSRRRAASVARWLVAHDIASERLQAYGCGETIAIDSNDTDAGRQANRRVEFHIVDPAPTAGARTAEGCEPIAF